MSVILIPAHNEAAVLSRTLRVLLDGLRPDARVLVLANGCSDDTVKLAHQAGVEVVEIQEASKTAALNAGEAAVEDFPRIYLDADIDLRGEDANRVLAVLEEGALAAEPRPFLDLGEASLAVRAWYRVWQALHGQRPGAVGSGLYALSAEGRRRFDEFPAVIADDGFVRAHFSAGEIQEVHGASSRVLGPQRLKDLIKIKTRSRLGNLQLRARFPDLPAFQARSSAASKAARLPLRLLPLLPFYVAVQLFVRRRAKQQARAIESYVWERDESSR